MVPLAEPVELQPLRPDVDRAVDPTRDLVPVEADRIPLWNPNQLRHSAGTEIRKHFGLEGAQVFLGHEAADVTQVYAEADIARAADIAREVG